MADVFLSYAEQDGTVADQIVAALRLGGIAIAPTHPLQQPPGVKKVARELTSAKCIVVLWSEHSVHNELVLAEADYARSRDILVSAVIGKPPLPLGFRDVWFANLTNWTGAQDSDAFLALKDLVEARLNPRLASLGATPAPQPPNRAREVPSIFLCYRREDTQDAARHLAEKLGHAYGIERVFVDIDSVPLGVDFVDHVKAQIARCTVVIVMIGKLWLTIRDKKRRRRLDDPDDLVRAEVRAALQQTIPVIPVIVQNASMPAPDDLPEDIRPLARRNGIELSHARWNSDVERLLKELDKVMKV